MTFISNSGTNQPVIDYSSRDYTSIYTDLTNRIPLYLPEWTSRSPNDFGIVLLQMFSYVGDILGYYMDRLSAEAFLQTATQPQSILNIAQMLNYQPTQSVGAVATLQITIASTVIGPFTIPAGTQFSTIGSTTQPPIYFTTDQALTIAGANAATSSTSGTVTVTQAITYTNQSVGTSDGSVNQSFQLLYSPVQTFNSNKPQYGLTVSVDLGLGPQAWTFSAHLIDNGPNDYVYTTFTAPNNVVFIQFGDNVNGFVPPLGSPITATYSVGVGELGNVGGGTITQPVSALMGVTAVTNPNAATGGTDPQALSSIQQNAPLALKSLNRAVTLDDFSTLSLQVSGVEWASAQEVTYQLVNLYVAPFGGGNPSASLIAAVQNYLAPFTMANTTMTVQNPTYVGVNITAAVVASPNFGNTATQVAVQNSLANLLALPNTGFGYRVSIGLIYETILQTTGVNYAFVTAMTRSMTATLTSALSNGSNYSSLLISQLPQEVFSGDSIVINQGGSHTQTVIATSNALAGATSIAVSPFTANAAYPIGTTIVDTTGVNDAVFLSNEIPILGTLTITVTGGLAGS